MTDKPQRDNFRAFLDGVQYSRTGILRYERIFGPGFVSTGGLETTKVSLPTPTLLPARHWDTSAPLVSCRLRDLCHRLSLAILQHLSSRNTETAENGNISDIFHGLISIMLLQEFVGMLGLKPDERVLDVGCGIGEPPWTLPHDFRC